MRFPLSSVRIPSRDIPRIARFIRALTLFGKFLIPYILINWEASINIYNQDVYCQLVPMIIKAYKDYWIGFVVISAIGATVLAFKSREYSLFVEILFGTVMGMIISMLAGLVIFLLTWLFTKDFSFLRFLRISIIVCFILTFTQIIDSFLNN